MKKFIAMLLAAVMLVALLGGCGSDTTADSGKSDVEKVDVQGSDRNVASSVDLDSVEVMDDMVDCIVAAVDDDSFTMSPWGGDSATRTWTEHLVYTCLAYRPFVGSMLNKDELELVAAKNVTKVNDTTYQVEIYDNITDSKGNKITAEDVVFSYDTLYSLGYVSYINTYYAGSKVLGDYKLEITLTSGEEGAIETVLANCNIASKAWYESASEDEILTNPACTGAYKVTDVQAAHSVTMEARDDYWKTEDRATMELQNVKTIQVLCVTEADARAIALQNHEVDLAEVATVAVPDFAADTEHYVVTRYANAMNDYLLFNAGDQSVCKDVNVRKAIAYAFDAATMFTLGYGNSEFELHHDVCPNQTPDYQDAWDTQEYYAQDIAKAKECLAAAGYAAGELTVRFLSVAQAPQGPYQALQQMCDEVGINIDIVSYDRALVQTYYADPTQWDITVSAASVADFTTTFWNRLFSEEQYGAERGTEGYVIDAKLQELLRAASADRSAENMNAFHDYVTEQCYALGLYNETKAIVTTAGLVDIHINNGDPVLNAMGFTSDYASAGIQN